MAFPKELDYLNGTTGKAAYNKIVNFSSNNSSSSTNSFNQIGNQTVFYFIYAALLLFSAIEEADWNILTAKNSNDADTISDNTNWNINNFFKLSFISNSGYEK